ncbi:MAG TPA: D-alanine--D-alanine ligase [Phycisphaerae bacterium]|nr:D-alanine--D-alanine ligase [Phycisphaerae bacterium]
MKKSTRPVRLGPAARSMRTKTLDITVLAGGPSDEREVSLSSGKSVAAALTTLGHRVTICDISPSDLSALDRTADIVFIALHGAFGEDGVVQAELERRRIPFVGSGSAASALAMDKAKTKARLIATGLPTPRFDVVRPSQVADAAERWRLPVVVKPIASGSSVDTHLVHAKDRLGQALHEVTRKYGQALVEELIDGPELTVSVLGKRALAPIEIRTKRAFYDYQAKYIDEDTQYLFDIPLPENLLQRLGELSLRAFAALGCRGFGRVDWMVDAITHEPYILEINTIPGFTSHSLLPKAAARAGLSFAELCQHIIELALLGDAAEQ